MAADKSQAQPLDVRREGVVSPCASDARVTEAEPLEYVRVYRIFALNFGSTSSKFAYFENDDCVVRATVEHPIEELAAFPSFWDQEDYRADHAERFARERHIDLMRVDAFVAWGGHTEPVEDGVYRISPKLLEQSRSGQYGTHPGDLATRLAARLAQEAGDHALALSVDPPTIDEFSSRARYTGLPGITRKSRMQTLNQKAVARHFADEQGRSYEDLNLVVVHMGGGTSVVAHCKGKMVDANNGLDGDGPMASNRAGTLPAGDLIDLCFSGAYTHDEARALVTGKGGLVAHLGVSDARVVEERIEAGDEHAREVYDAMIYQIAKQIASMAVALEGRVDAILLTGGVAHSAYVRAGIERYVSWIAPVHAYPGELEMASLGKSALRALRGDEKIKEL